MDVAFDADRHTLKLAMKNRGKLGQGLQARSATVPGAPYSYTVGAGDTLVAELTNPGTYDLSLHGPHGFFRHFAGSPATQLRVDATSHHPSGRLILRLSDGEAHHNGRGRSTVVEIADAYGRDRTVKVRGVEEITIDTDHSGGWYDIALTSPSDPTFSYQLAGRLESRSTRLTSDPQLGGGRHAEHNGAHPALIASGSDWREARAGR
jgi:phospholipase C